MVRRVREKAISTTVSKRPLGLMSKMRPPSSSRHKLAFWLSALLVVVAVPTSASAIRNHLDSSPPSEGAETTNTNNPDSGRSQTGASVRLETESRTQTSGDSAESPNNQSSSEVRINGQPVPLSDDGRFNQTIETDEGRTNVDVHVQNGTSSGAEEESETRTRIRIDTDTDFRNSVEEDLSVEIDE